MPRYLDVHPHHSSDHSGWQEQSRDDSEDHHHSVQALCPVGELYVDISGIPVDGSIDLLESHLHGVLHLLHSTLKEEDPIDRLERKQFRLPPKPVVVLQEIELVVNLCVHLQSHLLCQEKPAREARPLTLCQLL